MTKITYIPGEIANAAIDEHGNRKPVTRTQHIFDDAKDKNQAEINAEVDDTFAFHQSEINALNSQNYVTVDSFSSLPTTGAIDTVYRVSNWDGTQQDPTVYSEYAWNGEDYVHLSTKTQIGEIFDISAYHATGGELAKYADLAAALNGGANIPQSLQKGGMSVKFVQSSDNKYVQYRFMLSTFTAAQFVDVANWQGVVDRPISGSDDLINSGGVYECTKNIYNVDLETLPEEGIEIQDENGNVIHKITDNSANFKNLRSNNHRVLTEVDAVNYATLNDLESKQDVIEQLQKEDTEERQKEICVVDDDDEVIASIDEEGNVNCKSVNTNDQSHEDVVGLNDNEIVFTNEQEEPFVKIGNYGIKAKAYLNLDGTPLVPDNKIVVCIPDTIYAVVGDTLQLYYRSIYRCVDYSKYAVKVTCDIGAQYPRYFEVTPLQNQIGTHQVIFAIKDNNNNLLGTKTANLVVVSVVGSPQNSMNVLCLGASGTIGGQWVSEFKRRLVGNGGSPAGRNLSNINLVGRMDVTYQDIPVHLEATGGYYFPSYTSTTGRWHVFYFTAEHPAGELNVNDIYSYDGNNYTVREINLTDGVGNISCSGDVDVFGSLGTLTKVSGTGSQSMVFESCRSLGNPFAYNGSINMQQYADDYCNPQGAAHGTIDVIYTELFVNGTPAYGNDLSYRMDQMMAFINQVRTTFPNCKFCIGLSWNPDIKGGMGRNYGATGEWSDPYAIKYSNMNLCNTLQEYINDNNLSSYVFILNWLNEFDEENNMQQTLKKKNVRMPDEPITTGDSSIRNFEPKEVFGVNGVHPAEYGYYQMADTAYRMFIAKFCQ